MIANGTFTLLRGESTDTYGDQVDSNEPVQDRIPMALVENARLNRRIAGDRPGQVLYYVGRCSPELDIRQGDRVKDEATGTLYLVSSVGGQSNPIMASDTRLELERVTTGVLTS